MQAPLLFRVRGTVVLRIWWKVIIVSVYTAFIYYLHVYHSYLASMQIKYSGTFIRTLGLVTGLLLVFRTNTAYDRYYEGRKLWSTVKFNIRTLTRCFWVMAQEKKDSSNEDNNSSRRTVGKISAINLLIAFAYATRNYLRGDYSYHDDEELHQLIGHLPRFSRSSSVNELQEDKSGDKGNNAETRSRSHSDALSSTKRAKMWSGMQKEGTSSKAYEVAIATNIPIEITYYIASYIRSVQTDSAIYKDMNSALNSMTDCLGGFERILRTPIPLAYAVHIHHVTWLYVAVLPYALIKELDLLTIPSVASVAFALFGILEVGREIENPFGTDQNDLPIDDLCYAIHYEILGIIGHTLPEPESWLLSNENRPFPEEVKCNKTAADLTSMTEEEVRATLANNARYIQKGFWERQEETSSSPHP